MVGYWQGLPLGIAGHLMLAISVGTAAYYFGTVMEQKKNSGWLRYVYAIGWGYVGQVGMGLFLLWCLIGEQALTILVPWSVAALLAMLLALAVDYAWPDHLRHVIGGPQTSHGSGGKTLSAKELMRKHETVEIKNAAQAAFFLCK